MEATRRLWSAVLVQAYDDLQYEPYGSYWFNQSVAFFWGANEWVEARRDICDYLGLAPNALRRPATRMLNARRLEHGLPPLAPTPRPALEAARSAQAGATDRAGAADQERPWPVLIAIPAPAPTPKRRGGAVRDWRQRYEFNPFAPLPSERAASGA